MPYVVYALKWRPQTFEEIVGQPHIVATLKNAILKNRLAHAYLFAGPRGVGKTSTARILAKALNCKEGPTATPCGKCPSCVEIAQGRSLDVIEIDGASNRGIDEIRVLRESIKFAPVTGRFKIYIIDEVHMLTHEAFNALLKTLEEPPEFAKFVFATTQPNKVIQTILSRCQRFDFRRIPVMETIAQLEKIAAAEKIGVDKDVLFAIAKASDGALRDAESILDQLVSFSKDKIVLADAVSALGLIEQDVLFEITDNILQKDARGALGVLGRVIDEGKDISVFLANLTEHFRNLMVARITQADPKLIDLPRELCQRLLQQAQGFSPEELFSAFNVMANTLEMTKRFDSLRIPLEVGIVKLAHDKRGTAAAPVHTVSPAHAPAPAAQAQPIAPTAEARPPAEPLDPPQPAAEDTPVTLEEMHNAWPGIIEALGKVKMSVATYMNEGSPLKLAKAVLTIAFPKDYSLHKEALETKENRALIEKVVSEHLNTKLRVNFILSNDTVPRADDENPIIKSALRAFNGRVIKEE